MSVESDATLGDAAQLMIKKNIRRLMVKQDSKYVAIVTQREINGWRIKKVDLTFYLCKIIAIYSSLPQ